MITSIILSHYKQRENHLIKMVNDLMTGTVKPNEIVIFVDNPEIEFNDDRITVVHSNKSFLPRIRFALGTYFDTEYCFFIDDDLSVQPKTLENFMTYANTETILGYQGSILGDTNTPYANDKPVRRGNELMEVDIILRTYFVPTKLLFWGLKLQALHPELPKKSLDDIYLSLGNKYLNKGKNMVIPVNQDANISELGEGGVGQSYNTEHYGNRNLVCRKLMDIYNKHDATA